MNLLLDTHAWLWFALGDSRLSAAARIQIQDPQHVKFISPASYWELSIKISLGKYKLTCPYGQFMQQSIVGNGLMILPIAPQHAERVSSLLFPSGGHRDPFDRLLVAQALVEGMAVISHDAALDQYNIQRIW